MQPQDQFDRRLDATIAALTAWSETWCDVADVTIEKTSAFWRLRLDPKAIGACAAEVILHRRQTCDWMIGNETYEGLPLDDLDAILPVLDAVTAGTVTTRSRRSAMTDKATEIATVVGDRRAPRFERRRTISPTSGPGDVASERHYLPYRR